MPEDRCWFVQISEYWQTCVGCRPEGCNLNEGSEEYPPFPTEDPHRRSFGLHESIKKVLQKHIYLKPEDITRIVFTYFGESQWRKGIENCYAGITVEIKNNAFIMGNLTQGDVNVPSLLGWFWIGKTRYLK